MTLAIKMRGEINEILIPATFGEFVSDMNLAGAGNKQYIIMEDMEEHKLAINTNNILTVREIDDDLSGMIG